MPTYADYGGRVISTIAGRFEVTADRRRLGSVKEFRALGCSELHLENICGLRLFAEEDWKFAPWVAALLPSVSSFQWRVDHADLCIQIGFPRPARVSVKIFHDLSAEALIEAHRKHIIQ
jgi:hypothetical protein